jgi:AcrR family transcriptional regulator
MLSFQDFKKRVAPTLEHICRDLIRENKGKISVKKEEVAVRNMMRILEAVFALNREKGFETMSLRDLSRKSGLSMGALYSYFPGKEELRSMILHRGVAYTRQVIEGQTASCSDPVEKLEAAMETHLYLTEVLRPWFYFAYMEASSLSRRERQRSMEDELATEQIFLDILNEGVESRDFDCPDVDLVAALIKAALQDWYLKRWKYKRKGVAVEEYARFVVGFVLSRLTEDAGRRGMEKKRGGDRK